MNSYQRDRCIYYISKLSTWEVCQPFIENVDPEKDGAPDYNLFIKEPMCLNEIKRKLENNLYDDMDSLKHDIDLIWLNSKTYNGPDAYYTLMAYEGRNWFLKKIKNLPNTAEEDWIIKINRLTRKFYDALCHPPPDLDPSGKLTKQEKQVKPVPYRSKGIGKGKLCGKTIQF